MQVVNVHCTNYTPEDFMFPEIAPGKSSRSSEIDLRGTKIFVAWVKTSESGKVRVQYLNHDKSEVVQESDEFDLEPNKYRRLQFGTYHPTLQLPAMYIRFVVTNTSSKTLVVTTCAEAQIQ